MCEMIFTYEGLQSYFPDQICDRWLAKLICLHSMHERRSNNIIDKSWKPVIDYEFDYNMETGTKGLVKLYVQVILTSELQP